MAYPGWVQIDLGSNHHRRFKVGATALERRNERRAAGKRNRIQRARAQLAAAWMTDASLLSGEPADLRVALLTNCLSPHTLPLCDAMSARVREFRAFLSAEVDSFHDFPKVQAAFPVTIQRSLNAIRLRRRDHGFWSTNQLHIPYDTFQQLARYRPDVVLSCQFGTRTLLSVLYKLRHPETRLFLWANVSTHTEQNRAWYRRILRRWLVRHIDGAFVNGAEGAEYLRSLRFAGPISSLPYTIDETLFLRKASYRPANGVLRLLYCGRLDPCKGVRKFCERLNVWCASNPDTRIQFEIVGDGADGTAIRALSSAPNLTISVLPRMEQSRLARRYHQADLFVLPTFADEWAVVVNEAMLAGLPVLGSIYSQAVTEIVVDGASGWHFDPESKQSTLAALDRALSATPETLCMLSANAIQRMESFSPARVANQTVRVVCEVARRHTQPAAQNDSEPAPLLSAQSPEAVP